MKSNYNYYESAKKHALTTIMLRPGVTFMYFSNADSTMPLWVYNSKDGIYCDNEESFIGASSFAWMMQKYQQKEDFCWILDFINEQNMDLWSKTLGLTTDELITDIKRNLPEFKLGNNPEKVKTSLQYAWIDLQSILRLIDYSTNCFASVISSTRVVNNLRDCTTTEELTRLFLSDFRITGKEENDVEDTGSNVNKMPKDESFHIESSNNGFPHASKENVLRKSWIDVFGGIYSADKKLLLSIPENVKEYIILDGTEVICDYAFSNYEPEDIDYYEITESGRNIQDCIHSTSELFSVTIPDSVKNVGKGIFSGCYRLKTIRIPEGTREKFEKLLPDYKDLFVESVIIGVSNNDGKYVWLDDYDVQYDIEQNLLIKAPKSIKKYSVIDGTRIIANAAFSNCEQLKSVILPDSVTEIGHYAFAGCKSIFSFAIPNRVTTMGNGVFMDCRELSSIRLPAGLTSLENDIFQGCDNLNSVFVPKDDKYKYDELLYGHEVITHEYDPQNKEEIEVLDRILHGIVDESGVLYDFEEDVLISATREIESYSIKPGTVGIRNEAFKPDIWHYEGISLKRLYLPDSITMIGDAAFAHNEALEYINIPRNATIFTEDNPFAGCTNLHTIKWETEKAIKEGTLIYNKEKTALIACLPWHYKLNSWPLLAFAKQHGKMQLGTFKDNKTGEEFKSCIFTSPDDGTQLFVGFSSETGVLTPKEIVAQKNELAVVQLESGNYCLCKAIIEQESIVELPDGLETIAANAFYHNDVLQEITLPKTIKLIGKDAFKGCTALKVIYIPQGSTGFFEELLPDNKEKLVEKYEDVIEHLIDFELPDGSIYNGQGKVQFGALELCGQGEIRYPNGEKYNGEFKYGRPLGWGKYTFTNGHIHKGYFDSVPNGLGYLNENYSMTVGFYGRDYDGDINKCRLNGWGISYRNGIFKFGYWKNGKLVKDETNNTLWIRKQISNERTCYRGNLIQIGKEYDFIRFGIPPKLLGGKNPDIPIEKIPKTPAWGFEFFKDGSVKVGAIRNHNSGEFTLYYPDGTSELGKWKDGVKTFLYTIEELQKPIDEYEVDGLDVF